MIITYSNFEGIVVLPFKDDPVLSINPDTTHSLEFAFEFLKAISRWRLQIINQLRCIQNHQFLSGSSLYMEG